MRKKILITCDELIRTMGVIDKKIERAERYDAGNVSRIERLMSRKEDISKALIAYEIYGGRRK